MSDCLYADEIEEAIETIQELYRNAHYNITFWKGHLEEDRELYHNAMVAGNAIQAEWHKNRIIRELQGIQHTQTQRRKLIEYLRDRNLLHLIGESMGGTK